MSNMINVYILLCLREQMATVELCVSPVLTQIKTFGIFMAHIPFDISEGLSMLLCQI